MDEEKDITQLEDDENKRSHDAKDEAQNTTKQPQHDDGDGIPSDEGIDDTTEHDTAERAPDDEADQYILWAAGRAAAIAIAPIPLADIGPLMANEAYMIYRIAETYGYKIDKSVVAMILGVCGGSIVGKITASFLPFLKVPIAAGITYAVGKTAKAYFESGMTLSKEDMKNVFKNSRKEADDIDWNKKKVEADQL